MTKLIYVLACLMIAGGLAYHLAALALFNLLAPKDPGSRLVAEDVAYGPDLRNRLDIYAPDRPGEFPVILFAYGGGWDSGSKANYGFAGRALAAQGYVVAVVDYRLVPEVHYPAFVDDVALAAKWLKDHASQYGGDGTRMFAMGHSAGAYNVVQAALRAGPVQPFRAIAALAGPFDFLPLDVKFTINAFGKVNDLDETQPVKRDLSHAPPMLFLHGTSDKTVGTHNSLNLHHAMQAAGRQSQVKLYDGASHAAVMLALSRPFRSTAPTLKDAIAFFQKYD